MSIKIKDTTREERIAIVRKSLAASDEIGCENLGMGAIDDMYLPYINGEMELRELNMQLASGHRYELGESGMTGDRTGSGPRMGCGY